MITVAAIIAAISWIFAVVLAFMLKRSDASRDEWFSKYVEALAALDEAKILAQRKVKK